MDGAASVGELIYMDEWLRWSGLAKFYGVLYLLFVAPLTYWIARNTSSFEYGDTSNDSHAQKGTLLVSPYSSQGPRSQWQRGQ